MFRPLRWFALYLLVAGVAAAQPRPAFRERQDRHTFLASTPTELRVAAGNLTTVMLNGPLDRDSLVVDRTRFKWAEVGDQALMLQPVADLGPGERLVVKAKFKDRAVPAQAIFVVTTHPTEVDGTVEVDRRANTPEALSAALADRDAQIAELKARCEASGLAAVVLSGWLDQGMQPISLESWVPSTDSSGLQVKEGVGYQGTTSAVVALSVRNLPGQKPWVPGEAHLMSANGTPAKVLSVQMKPPQLAPGEVGRLVVETNALLQADDLSLRVELMDASGARHLSFTLKRR